MCLALAQHEPEVLSSILLLNHRPSRSLPQYCYCDYLLPLLLPQYMAAPDRLLPACRGKQAFGSQGPSGCLLPCQRRHLSCQDALARGAHPHQAEPQCQGSRPRLAGGDGAHCACGITAGVALLWPCVAAQLQWKPGHPDARSVCDSLQVSCCACCTF